MKGIGLAGLSWLTPVGHLLRGAGRAASGAGAVGDPDLVGRGPSQLETFDPHPHQRISAGTQAIATAVKGVQLARGYEGLAEVLGSVSLVRSLVSQEGDHERGTYLMKNGYRPDPTVEHPSIGAICCHEPLGGTGIPRHISILPGQWPGRGGFLGGEFDAFKTGDPLQPLPDVTTQVPPDREVRRIRDLEVVERVFRRGRQRPVAATLHRETVERAR